MKTKIVSVFEKQEWNEVVTRAACYDFYHCNSYNALANSGEPFLFVAEDKDDFIAIPLIKREIEKTGYFDCTSVWGYPGPVSSKLPPELNAELIAFFQNELRHYMVCNKIIAAFSRLHPIIPQEQLLNDLGAIIPLNKTVAINLTLSPEVQRQQYRKTHKLHINRLRKKEYHVKRAGSTPEINAFFDIYTETMQRVNADKFYFDCFGLDYFHDLLQLDDARPNLLLACNGSEIVAGGVFIATEKYMQYHVGGTKAEHMKDTPMKLVIDEARLLANQMKLQYLHLGGGVNGTDEDSLFYFKTGFSDRTFLYKVWKLIVDEEVYQDLAMKKAREKEVNTNFFPVYRS